MTLNETPFLRQLTNLAALVIKKHDGIDRLRKSEKISAGTYSDKEAYVVDCLLALGEVELTFTQLRQTPYFLNKYRQNFNKDMDINKFDYLIYHIEPHFFRITGLLDRVMILVNKVLLMKLNSKECKTYALLPKRNGKRKKDGKYAGKLQVVHGLVSSIENLEDVVDDHRQQRNIISHQGRFQGADLVDVEMYNLVLSSPGPSDISPKYARMMQRETNKAIDNYCTRMETFNSIVRQHINNIYDCLHKSWFANYKDLD